VEVFRELGDDLRQRWAACGEDEAAFTELALEVLTRHNPAGAVSPDDVLRWVCTTKSLVRQRNLGSPFGQPPVTVYDSERFYVDVYFWLDGTTQIHQHGFAGAFQVLGGGSIETRYGFAERLRVDRDLLLGDLRVDDVRRLRPGDSRPIWPGSRTIHALFHLDRPSATVVARTSRLGSDPQYTYGFPGVAYDPERLPQRLTQCLELLARIEHPERLELFDAAVRDAPPATAFVLLEAAAGFLASKEECAELASRVAAAHPVLASVIHDYVAERRRQLHVASLRTRVRSAPHRLLLALLLTVPSRDGVLRLVQEEKPGAPPLDTLMDWIQGLTGELASGASSGLDASELRVLRHVLAGASDARVVEALGSEYDATDVETQAPKVVAMCQAFRNSDLFRPLFAR
jgi:hypothetical protein